MAYTGLQLSKNKDIHAESVITQLDLAEKVLIPSRFKLQIPDLDAPCEHMAPVFLFWSPDSNT